MKNILILLITLNLCTLSFAQIHTRIGIKPGLSLANQTWYMKVLDLEQDRNARTGLYLGACAEFGLSNQFSVVTDLGYIQKGSRMKVETTTVDQPDGTGNYYFIDYHFDFLTFSPSLQFSKQLGKFRPFINAGPRLDYLLNKDFSQNLSYLENDINELLFGLNLGFGAGYRFGKLELGLGAQYQFDFDHFLDVNYPGGTGLTIDNRVFLIQLGIAYLLE